MHFLQLNNKRSYRYLNFIFLTFLFICLTILSAKHISETQHLESLKLKCLKNTGEGYETILCLKSYLEELTRTKSAKVAIQETILLKNQKHISECHLAAHFIGKANYDKFKTNVSLAFATCPTLCLEGCQHGVMDAYINASKNLETALFGITNTCQSITSSSWLKRQCLHGVGHGIVRHNEYNIVEAINLCNKFPDEYSADKCIGGVMMEYTNQYLSLDENSFIQKLRSVCIPVITTKKPDTIKRCFSNLGGAIVFYVGKDMQKSLKLCENLLPEYITMCKDGVRSEIKIDSIE